MKISIIIPVYNNERFVMDAMQSVRDQEIDDLEMIVVNDGSADNSEAVIREFAKEYPATVVISQENQGVSAARNAALDIAKGEYIGFLDSDDVFRPNALRDMLFIADDNRADMVIGESRSVGTFADSVLPQARRLSKRSYISKDDVDLVYNFSVCNKIFRREIIEKYHIRFQPIKHAEDGLFLFSYLKHCESITGCPRYMYEYRKRVVLDSQSALKSLDESMLASVLEATDKIGEIIKENSETLWDEFTRRVLRVTLINEYYRRLWTLDDAAFGKLVENMERYKAMMDEESWQKILDLSLDIEIEDGFRSKAEIAADPRVSVLIPAGLEQEDYDNVLHTLYFQLCPNFEAIVDSSYKDITSEDYSGKINFHFCDAGKNWRKLLDASHGRMITVVDAPCIYHDGTLQQMVRQLNGSGRDFVSIRMRGYEDGNAYILKGIEGIYDKKKSVSNETRAEMNSRDHFWMNKMFFRDSICRLFDYCEKNDPKRQPADYVAVAFKLLMYGRNRAVIGVPMKCFSDLKLETKLKESAPDKKKKKQRLKFDEIVRRAFYFVCSFFIPVKKNKVLFLSDIRDSIGGNYETLLFELERKHFDVICDFKSAKRSYESKRRKLIRMYHLATSHYIVLEDFHKDTAWIRIRKNQELVQLWHAAGAFKKFAWSRASGNEDLNISPGYRKITKAIVSAEDIRVNYAEAFHIDESCVYATGLPRTDIFYNREYLDTIRDKYDAKYPFLKGKKILLVAPTYRGVTLAKATYDFSQLDPGRMLEVLGDDYIIIFKWHPALVTALKKSKKSAYKYSKYDGRVVDLSHERDVNDLLMIADACITDYSSVIFEYELLNKPMIYYWYDMNDYKLGRGVYYDLDEYVYGRVAYNFDQLLDALRDMDMCEDRRAAFHKKFMSACDGNATRKVADIIFKK